MGTLGPTRSARLWPSRAASETDASSLRLKLLAAPARAFSAAAPAVAAAATAGPPASVYSPWRINLRLPRDFFFVPGCDWIDPWE